MKKKLAILLVSLLLLLQCAFWINACGQSLVKDCCAQAIDYARQVNTLTDQVNEANQKYRAEQALRIQTAKDGLALADLLRTDLTTANSRIIEAGKAAETAIEKRNQVLDKMYVVRDLVKAYAMKGGFLGIGRRRQLRRIYQELSE